MWISGNDVVCLVLLYNDVHFIQFYKLITKVGHYWWLLIVNNRTVPTNRPTPRNEGSVQKAVRNIERGGEFRQCAKNWGVENGAN